MSVLHLSGLSNCANFRLRLIEYVYPVLYYGQVMFGSPTVRSPDPRDGGNKGVGWVRSHPISLIESWVQ